MPVMTDAIGLPYENATAKNMTIKDASSNQGLVHTQRRRRN